jgi:hypothetical protein
MPTLLGAYFASTFVVPALAVAAIVIGVTVRVALMVQPGTRFQSYWSSFFKTHHPPTNSN